ncbi:Chromosome (plasmid) partitioning protein ParA / Sporulation initiation inhibitor protein Soj [Thioalkalivibrio nitratireducens DSM 14787]|uniref:Cobyrinic acid a,c-diamide synthase n=2 Tax=Thioalkalivibrio TaxID=106633 RepID=W0DGF4_9GAMM|nr:MULTISPECIES: AAA family ATPase [Thioalkalivibrio]AGA34581.1 Chromosome (plasmid) partitioning protein ParA / Sporulation initiation inhibitor protein Soj [Thioalkalivibrio nitratireducens DSM 14787]AHE97704.1 cobyrinic acid a,c-diamide synthase [Thioalkalivibrio paradoxus ARh 1]
MLTVIGNLKGGTGKSTVAFNLALWVLSNKRTVLAVDLDPQATLTDVIRVREEEGYSPSLELSQSLEEALHASDKYQEIIVDVGPSDLGTMYAAILAADQVVIPVPPSQADVWSTQRFVRKILELRGDREKPEIVGFINRADTHQAVRESDEAFGALGMIDGLRAVRPRLRQRMAFRRSFSEGLSVHELERRGKAAHELDELARALFRKSRR